MPLSYNENVLYLKKDILNGPFHVFGSHAECARYHTFIHNIHIFISLFFFFVKKNLFSCFCSGPKKNKVNLVPQMENCGLWRDILGARNIIAHHANSLIYDVNNNVVEGFNSVIAKYVG